MSKQKLEMLEQGIVNYQVDAAWDYIKEMMDEGAKVRHEMLTRALVLIIHDLHLDEPHA